MRNFAINENICDWYLRVFICIEKVGRKMLNQRNTLRKIGIQKERSWFSIKGTTTRTLNKVSMRTKKKRREIQHSWDFYSFRKWKWYIGFKHDSTWHTLNMKYNHIGNYFLYKCTFLVTNWKIYITVLKNRNWKLH